MAAVVSALPARPMTVLARILPKSLVGQLVLATALLLFVAQAVSFTLLVNGQSDARLMRMAFPAANRIIDVSDRIAVGQSPNPQRRGRRMQRVAVEVAARSHITPGMRRDHAMENRVSELLHEANVRGVTVRAAERKGPPPIAVTAMMRGTANDQGIRDRLGGNNRSARDPSDSNTMLVSAQIPDGRWINITLAAPKTNPALFGLLAAQTLLLYLLLLAPIAWIGWRVSRPLKALTNAVRNANPAAMGDPVAETGPDDVSDLIRAFNAMRARIAAMLGEKDRMLGALGHDLRTPLASLRVRVESVDDDMLRTKMVATMDEMAVMLDDILALARSGQVKEAVVATDVGALVSAVVEDYRETGSDVAMDAVPDHLVRLMHPVPMRRALRNLIDNALKYGHRARVTLKQEAGRAVIAIADDGAGIEPHRIAEMLEPFTRAEISRSRETGGAGLGLALAKAIIDQQGGELKLVNGEGGGLIAKIILA